MDNVQPLTDKHTPWKLDDSGNPDDAGMIWDAGGRLIAETFVYNKYAGDDRREELDLAEFIVTAVNSYDLLQAVVTAAEELVKQAKNAHEELEEHELNGEDALCCLLWKDLLPGLQRSIDDTSAALAAARGAS